MKAKNFSKFDFKKIHPGGSLSLKLKTVEDLMIKGKKVPFLKEDIKMKRALKIIEEKKLGVLIVKKKNGYTSGIITDGDIKRIARKYKEFDSLELKKVMKKNPISIDKEELAATALSLMNAKEITSLCVHEKNKKRRTIGIIHMHSILKSNIS